MARKANVFLFRERKKIKRKGIHSKSKSSKNKKSKLYKKRYNGQGR